MAEVKVTDKVVNKAASKDKGAKILVLFSLIGVLFSGFLTFTKLLLGACPLKEPCPYFLGYPACFYGFIMFLILFVASLLLAFNKYDKGKLLKVLSYVSLIGIIFSLYSTYAEMAYPLCLGGCEYSMLLPTCVYGFIFYLIVFAVSLKMKK
jgi:hypothetical protein